MICIINATWQQIRRQCQWHDCVAYINQQTVELSSRLKGVLFMYLYSCQYFQKKNYIVARGLGVCIFKPCTLGPCILNQLCITYIQMPVDHYILEHHQLVASNYQVACGSSVAYTTEGGEAPHRVIESRLESKGRHFHNSGNEIFIG